MKRLLVLALLGLATGCGISDRVEVKKPEAKQALRSRDEFKKLIMGKTKDDVLRLIGKPSDTASTGLVESWFYKSVSYDPITNKPYGDTSVHFSQDVVFDISCF